MIAKTSSNSSPDNSNAVSADTKRTPSDGSDVCNLKGAPSEMLYAHGAECILSEASFETIAKNEKSQVISPDTRTFAQLVKLHRAIDSTYTKLGRAALMCDLVSPPNTLVEIQLRRAAIDELNNNVTFREALELVLQSTRQKYYFDFALEDNALGFFIPHFYHKKVEEMSMGRKLFLLFFTLLNNERMLMYSLKAVGVLFDKFKHLPKPESKLLQAHLETIRTIMTSDESELLKGKIYTTWNCMEAPGKVPPWMPAFSSHAGKINFEQLLLNIPAGASFFSYGSNNLSKAIESGQNLTSALGVLGVAAIPLAMAVTRLFKVPIKMAVRLRERVINIANLGMALNAIGQLDSLLTLSKLPERFGTAGCFPKFVEAEKFCLNAKNLHNPVLLANGGSVANDVSLRGGRVQVLTGPNSGGKTTFAVTLFQNLVLAHLGTAVAATDFESTVADQLIFQGPSFEALGEHGRFGTELSATRDAFMRSTSNSFVVLDEVGDGTTAEERTELASSILWGFSKIGCGVILVTHNIALADKLQEENSADMFQVAMSNDNPTFKVIHGISRCSNADRVARALGFSTEDINRIVLEKTSRYNADKSVSSDVDILRVNEF